MTDTENLSDNLQIENQEEKMSCDNSPNVFNDKGPDLKGVALGISLCNEIIRSVGKDSFHGGVRPENIAVKGTAVSLGSRLAHGVGEFTPQELEYMAPELFWDGLRTPAADVYSIGLVLYAIYNYGRLPFWPSSGIITPDIRAAALQRRMNGETILPPVKADDYLSEVIEKALSFRTDSRWSDVSELGSALEKCSSADDPAGISLVMTGLLSRTPSASVYRGFRKTTDYEADEPIDSKTFKAPVRRKKRSYLRILPFAVFLIAAIVTVYFKYGNVPSVDKEPQIPLSPVKGASANAGTAEISEPSATPEPTAAPTPEPTPVPDGPRFIAVVKDVSWSEAVKECESMGGRLAVPDNQQELDEIIRVSEEASRELKYVWIGASRQADVWITTESKELTFYFWGPNEPSFKDAGDGAAEDFMLLWKNNGIWSGNDSRENPMADYGWLYTGSIGFVCQMY